MNRLRAVLVVCFSKNYFGEEYNRIKSSHQVRLNVREIYIS